MAGAAPHEPANTLHDGAVLVASDAAGRGIIEWVGRSGEADTALAGLSDDTLTRISLRDHIALPGLINTHHHLYQTLTRVIAQDSGLFDWLKTLYPIWLGLTSEAIYISALTGLAELMLSGCTTASDHLYIYPNDCRIDDEIRAAQEIGIRFHATRGSMSLGESQGGLPPDRATEREADILRDSVRAIETYHDPTRHAMLRIALAPCSPFSVTGDLMRESAALGRSAGVMLHTHLAETRDEEAFCLGRFGMRPLDYAASVDWIGPDVWYAHGVHFNTPDIQRMATHGCGVAHCPSSNMRLASGIAPVRLMMNTGVKVGLGVDGSASNDSGHLLAEARQALLVSRLAAASEQEPSRAGQSALSAREAIWLATRGGAAVLGRDDIGRIAPGCSADLIAIHLNRIDYAGALHDPLAAIVFCTPRGVDFSMINGRVVISEGRLHTIDLPRIIERHNQISRALLRGEPARSVHAARPPL
ncbi:MAG: 8-oxoguanine deaminase [Anaerolineae bacterium]|nr:8-oxoguanine deaminase [Thermoflexales bacterium]MDW8406983.1 8-oxoguanine deaminase [Anaerolineae bacterium]